jgi:hypothetical protein
MSTAIAINRPAKTLPGAAPVAMQRGRRGERTALARLRAKRRWLLRRLHDAGFAPSSPPPPRPAFPVRGTREALRVAPSARARR